MYGESELLPPPAPFPRLSRPKFLTFFFSFRSGRIDCSESSEAESRYTLAESLTSTAVQVSHGTDPAHSTANTKESYVSTAFFIRNEQTRAEFLFYGDVEPGEFSPSFPSV